jgi:hypothetical protein
MPRFTRMHALGLGLIVGALLAIGLLDAFGSPTVVEKEVTRWKTKTETKVERKEVRVPEAYTVVKWRNRIVRPQIDTTNGRHDTVLVSEEFAARFNGADSSNGGTVEGWIRSHPLRVEDIRVDCPPDTSTRSSDSVFIERERTTNAKGRSRSGRGSASASDPMRASITSGRSAMASPSGRGSSSAVGNPLNHRR